MQASLVIITKYGNIKVKLEGKQWLERAVYIKTVYNFLKIEFVNQYAHVVFYYPVKIDTASFSYKVAVLGHDSSFVWEWRFSATSGEQKSN